jgi:hypothetical protein
MGAAVFNLPAQAWVVQGLLPKSFPSTIVMLDAPLLGLETTRLALKCSEEQVAALISSGDLEWAFDLRGKNSSRSYLRILSVSVARLQRGIQPMSLRERAGRSSGNFEEIFDGIFRHRKPLLLSSELMRVWNCSSRHIHDLAEDNLVSVVKRKYAVNEALLIRRHSVMKFMEKRRIS